MVDYGKLGFTLRSKVVPSHRPALSLPVQTEINNPPHKAAVKIKLGYRYKARTRMIGTREELRNDELPPLPLQMKLMATAVERTSGFGLTLRSLVNSY